MTNEDREYEKGRADSQSGNKMEDNATDKYIEGYNCINECAGIFNLETFDEAWATI